MSVLSTKIRSFIEKYKHTLLVILVLIIIVVGFLILKQPKPSVSLKPIEVSHISSNAQIELMQTKTKLSPIEGLKSELAAIKVTIQHQKLNLLEFKRKYYSNNYLYHNSDLTSQINDYCAKTPVTGVIALSNCNNAAKMQNPFYFVPFSFLDNKVQVAFLKFLCFLVVFIVGYNLLNCIARFMSRVASR